MCSVLLEQHLSALRQHHGAKILVDAHLNEELLRRRQINCQVQIAKVGILICVAIELLAVRLEILLLARSQVLADVSRHALTTFPCYPMEPIKACGQISK